MIDAELAIKYLEELKEKYTDGEGFDRHPLPEYYAIEDGIEALHKVLEKEPCEDAVEVWDGIHCQIVAPKGTFDKIYNDAEENEKAISREDAIKVIKSWFEKIELNPDILIDSIISLPSVTPIRPKGEWIEIVEEETAYGKTWHYECSKCGKHNTCLSGNPNFCPHCGADMKGDKK